MTGPPPAVARLRVAVRRALTELVAEPPAAARAAAGDSRPAATDAPPPDPADTRVPLVLVACSGGPDSMALAAATAFVAPRLGLRAGLATVDHGLQDGSAARAATVADWARTAGLDPVETATVDVDVSRGGPEAAARTARYTALTGIAHRHGAAAILLGHTRDDQAETVLLALARGSGPRGLAAMPVRRGLLLRPLLDLPRTDTVAACQALDLPVWDDPHNTDPAYTRSRLRAAMPVLTETFGARIVANLARTASLIAADTEALDGYAAELLAAATGSAASRLSVPVLAHAHRAVRTRALRAWALDHGADAEALAFVHIDAMDALVTRWRGQKAVFLPGRVTVVRSDGELSLSREPS